MLVPFYRHQLGEDELNSIKRVFDSDILTTGIEVDQFERKFSDFLGLKKSVGLQSCTAALQLALEAYEFEEGSEVITTPMTFVATSLAIKQARLVPVFAPIERETGNIDISKLDSYISSKTVAIIPVHLFGQMVDMIALSSFCKKHNLKCIEDSAHCVEGSRDGIRVGELSDAACFSFYATKNLSCGEGGCLSTNDEELARKVYLLRSHGVNKTAFNRYNEGYSHWNLSVLGWKYNMDNIHASILLPQLPLIESKRRQRERAASYYDHKLARNPLVSQVTRKQRVIHARHLYPIKVNIQIRDMLLEHLKSMGVGVVVNYRCLSSYPEILKISRSTEDSFIISKEFGDSVLSLPLFPGITRDQQDHVIEALSTFSLSNY